MRLYRLSSIVHRQRLFHLVEDGYRRRPAMTQVQAGEHNMVDYEATRRDFVLTAPEDFNWAFDVVDRWAEDPHKPAMLWVGPQGDERGVTFDEFRRRSN